MQKEINGCKYIIFKGLTKNPLVLLHGYSFKSRIWREVGLLYLLEERNLSYVAIDMPYGKISECKYRNREVDFNINLVKKLLEIEFSNEPPVILGASLGGFIALQYGIKHNILGLILIAPVWSNRQEIIRHYSENNIPILLIYGDKDTIVSLEEMEKFREETRNTNLVIYRNAPHPAYLKYPDKFSREVAKYLEDIVKH